MSTAHAVIAATVLGLVLSCGELWADKGGTDYHLFGFSSDELGNYAENEARKCRKSQDCYETLVNDHIALARQMTVESLRRLTPDARDAVAKSGCKFQTAVEYQTCIAKGIDSLIRKTKDPAKLAELKSARYAIGAAMNQTILAGSLLMRCCTALAGEEACVANLGQNKLKACDGIGDQNKLAIRSADVPYDPKAPAMGGKGNAKDLGGAPAIFTAPTDNVTSVLGGNKIDCPDFIPTGFCDIFAGGSYDPSRFRKTTEVVDIPGDNDGPGSSYSVDRFNFVGVQDMDFGGMKASEFRDGLYKAVRPNLRQDLAQFAGGVFVENYIQNTVLTCSTPAERNAAMDELQKTLDGPGKCMSNVSNLKMIIDGYKTKMDPGGKANAEYRNRMALAAECMTVLNQRFGYLKKELGGMFDVKTVGELTHSGPSKYAMMALSAVPGFGIFQHLPVMIGLEESARQNCGALYWQNTNPVAVKDGDGTVNVPRESYCSNVRTEFGAVTNQMSEIYSGFPSLVEDVGGKPGFQSVTDGVPLDPRVANYNLDLNRDQPTSQYNSCMNKLRKNPADPKSPFSKPDPKLLANSDKLLAARAGPQRKTMRDELEKICNDPNKYANALVTQPNFLSQYFNCKRKRYPMLTSILSPSGPKPEQASDEGECRNRKSSGWVACQLFREERVSAEQKDVAKQLLGASLEALACAAPAFGEFSFSATGLIKGALIGGGLAVASVQFLDNPEDAKDKATTQVAAFYAGFASADSYKAAYTQLKALGTGFWSDPRVKGFIDGAALGAVLSMFQGEHGAERAGKSAVADAEAAARSESELIRVYKGLEKMEREGGLDAKTASQVGEAKAKLNGLFDETLNARDSEVAALMRKNDPADTARAIEIVDELKRKGKSDKAIEKVFEGLNKCEIR